MRQCIVGNTTVPVRSLRLKQLRAMISTGMGDLSRIEVDAVVKNTVKLLGRKHKIENNMF